MSTIAAATRPPRAPRYVILVQAVTIALMVAFAAGSAATGSPLLAVAGFGVALIYAMSFVFTSWRSAVVLLFLVIWFIPIKRYRFPVNLPFNLEPYRVLVAVLVLVWVAALLINPKLRLRRSGLELPLVIFLLAVLVSICANYRHIESVGLTIDVLKTLSFFVSFILTYFLVASVTRTRHDLDLFIKTLVAGGAIVAFFAIIEYRTGVNIFNHLSDYVPILHFQGGVENLTRSDRLRVYGSSQHPIALAAALVMMVPLGVYLGLTTRRAIWWIATGLLGMGALATLSRTGVVMFVASAVVFSILRPREARKMAPLLVVGLIAAFLILPQALGTLEGAFFPKAGLVADQNTVGYVGNGHTSGRLNTLGPNLKLWRKQPFFGQGFGTRIIDTSDPLYTNADILDDQWLGTLLETGAFGALALLWLIARSTRLLGRLGRRRASPDGLLAAALATSIVAFAAGAITYDAFSFIQVTFLFFLALALGSSLLVISRDGGFPERQPA